MANSNHNRRRPSGTTEIEPALASILMELLDAGEIEIVDVDDDGEPLYYTRPREADA